MATNKDHGLSLDKDIWGGPKPKFTQTGLQTALFSVCIITFLQIRIFHIKMISWFFEEIQALPTMNVMTMNLV
jgi:hypothetical protein